jgi:hypothetical protein
VFEIVIDITNVDVIATARAIEPSSGAICGVVRWQ